MKKISFFVFLYVFFTALAQAADTAPAAPADPEFEKARMLVEAENWEAAQQALEAYVVTHPNSADGFNLLGYSYRNQNMYDKSLTAYNKALELDPEHRGAHEYIGIAYVQMGQLDKAKMHLERLDDICFFSCDEYDDLKAAIESAAAQ